MPVKGEKLSDADFVAGFSNIVMEIAKTVSYLSDTFTSTLICSIVYFDQDDKVDASLLRVRCFLAPPTDLMHPSILAKVALFWIRRQLVFA